ncbi:MAG: GDP-L-fucose synthase [Candidatus Hydrogenedentes bacterium]|nr:GDP-L-fucose synthase [Candidatus Hydrogenedentota bacterium]
MNRHARIYVAGNTTMIGFAIVRALHDRGYANLAGLGDHEPDVTNPDEVDAFFARHRPQYVFVAAGKSGGIQANRERGAELMLHNLKVATTMIPSAHHYGVTKLLYLASSCVYPRDCAQPMKEQDLMTAPLEATNGPYALAKLAGIQLCQAYRQQYGAKFIVAIPANVFGPGDSFDPDNSHVVASLMRRMDDAKRTRGDHIDVWGTGTPVRELMPVADLARACLHVMELYDDDEPINLGNGHGLSVAELAETIRAIVQFRGEIRFDASWPDGMPHKILDSSKLRALGWEPGVQLDHALEELYGWYCHHLVPLQVEPDAA